MPGGSGVIAGPEVDMAELDPVSSSSLAVDLNLNLGPSFALELALGGQDFEGSVPVSRQNWPRFEPGILAEDPNPNLASAEDHHGSSIRIREVDSIAAGVRLAEVGGIDAGNDRNSVRIREVVGVHGRGNRGGNRSEGEGSLRGSLQTSRSGRLELAVSLPSNHIVLPLPVLRPCFFRNPRHTRHPRRPRQAIFAPVPDLVETQASSDHGSTTEGRALGANDSAPSVTLSRTRNPRTPNTCLEISLSHESNQEDGKRIQASPVGAHFECNICLEMATEPVVTCCGHLFCWPCLYQWLHLHSSQKECPVCKGFLSDDVITPIYGRGTAQDTDKPHGNTPSRPHAHRINGKRRWQDRFTQERPDGGVTAGAGRSEAQAERSEPEASNTAELILSRLRVAQRLQREHFDERFRLRLRQRIMGRRGGAFRSPGATAQAMASFVQSPEQHHSEHMLTRMTMNSLETADSLAAMGVSMDGLRENLEHVQRTLEIVSSSPGQAGISRPGGGANAGLSGLAGPSLNEERAPSSGTESHAPGHSTNGELQTDTTELPQTSLRVWRRAANGASGSFDTEPGSLHARKRRRLN